MAKTKPNLSDIKNVTISTPVSGDALVFDGSKWGNVPVQVQTDRITSGTTVMSVAAAGTAELTIGTKTAMTMSLNETALLSANGGRWATLRNLQSNWDIIGSAHTVGYTEWNSNTLAVNFTSWDASTGSIISYTTLTESVSGNPAGPDQIAQAPRPGTEAIYGGTVVGNTIEIINCSVVGTSYQPVMQYTIPGDSSVVAYRINPMVWISSSDMIISSALDTQNHSVAMTNISRVVFDTGDLVWSTSVVGNWVTCMYDNGSVVMVGTGNIGGIDIPDYVTAVVDGSGAVSLPTSFATGATASVDLYAGVAVGNIVYLGGEIWGNTADTSCVVAIDISTGNKVWQQLYDTTTPISDTRWSSIYNFILHPTIPNKLVTVMTYSNLLSAVGPDNGGDAESVIAIIDAITGEVDSSAVIRITDPVMGTLTRASYNMSLARCGNNIAISFDYQYQTVGNIPGAQKHATISVPDLQSATIGFIDIISSDLTAIPLPDADYNITFTQLGALTLEPAVTPVLYPTSPTEIIGSAVTPTASEPTARDSTPHDLQVDGSIRLTKDITLNGNSGANGDVIIKAGGVPTWGTVAGSDWITNPVTFSIANTHPSWVGTPYAPRDPSLDDNVSLKNNINIGAGSLHSAGSVPGDIMYDNVTIGTNSMFSLTRGNFNVSIGNQAASQIGEMRSSVCIGNNAGKNNSEPSQYDDQVIIGDGAHSNYTHSVVNATGAVAIGAGAAAAGGLGTGSIAIGVNSAGEAIPYSNTISIGSRAMLYGGYSGTIAIGTDSQQAATAINGSTGNTTVGYETISERAAPIFYSTTPMFCTAIGFQSMKTWANEYDNVNYNTAVGYQSLQYAGGAGNTAVGSQALRGNSGFGAGATGAYNTALGTEALYDSTNVVNFGAYNNCTGVGYQTRVTGDNQVQLGNSSTTTYAYGSVQNRSDARDKTDIRDTVLGLSFIKQLHPVDFKWDYREDYVAAQTAEDGTVTYVRTAPDGSKKRNRYHHGLIAQEVKQVLDTSGIDFGGYQDHAIGGGQDVLSIGYEELIAPLIKAVQQLAATVESQSETIADLQQTVANMQPAK